MNRYSNVCLQSFFGFGSQGPGKTKLKELKQGRFVSFQNIPSSYDYDLKYTKVSRWFCVKDQTKFAH